MVVTETALIAIAIASAVSAAASTGAALYQAKVQADATEQANDYQAQVAANNAKIAQLAQQRDAEAASEEESRQRMATAGALGEFATETGAGGIESSSGSALRTSNAIARFGQQDALTIRSNASARSFGHDVQMGDLYSQQQLAGVSSEWARINKRIGIGSSIASGASSLSSSAYMYYGTKR